MQECRNACAHLCLAPARGISCLLRISLTQAQSGSFEVAQHGHAVGTASFQFTTTPQGYDSTSLVRVAMQGLNYDLSKNEKLSSADHLEHGQLSAVVNGTAV